MEKNMNLFVSFGQNHLHKVQGQTFDCDCLALILCDDYADGRRIAFENFGDKFCTTYTSEQIAESSILRKLQIKRIN